MYILERAGERSFIPCVRAAGFFSEQEQEKRL